VSGKLHGEIAPGTHWVGVQVGPETCLGDIPWRLLAGSMLILQNRHLSEEIRKKKIYIALQYFIKLVMRVQSNFCQNPLRSQDSAVGITTGYGLDDRVVGVRVPIGSRIFSSPRRPDRLWGSIQSPIQWVPGAVSLGLSGRGVKLTTHIQLVSRSKMV
jgi:hypothetical protein